MAGPVVRIWVGFPEEGTMSTLANDSMKVFVMSALTCAIAGVLGVPATGAITPDTAAVEQLDQPELLSSSYIYRRYTGGTGRREILS